MGSLPVYVCSEIDQGIYHVQQNFRGTWFLADFQDFPNIYDMNAKKNKQTNEKTKLRNLHSQPAHDDPLKESELR